MLSSKYLPLGTATQVTPHAPPENEGGAVFVLSVLQSLSSIIRPKKFKNCFILKNLTTKMYAYIYRQVRPLKHYHLA